MVARCTAARLPYSWPGLGTRNVAELSFSAFQSRRRNALEFVSAGPRCLRVGALRTHRPPAKISAAERLRNYPYRALILAQFRERARPRPKQKARAAGPRRAARTHVARWRPHGQPMWRLAPSDRCARLHASVHRNLEGTGPPALWFLASGHRLLLALDRVL